MSTAASGAAQAGGTGALAHPIGLTLGKARGIRKHLWVSGRNFLLSSNCTTLCGLGATVKSPVSLRHLSSLIVVTRMTAVASALSTMK